MKRFILSMAMMLTVAMSTMAMSYEQARERALFLTDKMAYELNLNDEQYEAAYEVNLDYLMSINTYDDLYGTYWTRRNLDLSYILFDWQYSAFCSAAYFYRPLTWADGVWRFGIYARYPHRTYFYFGRPSFYMSYCGGHSWRMNGGRSWYHGRDFGPRPGESRFGMRDRFDRGDFRGPRSNGGFNGGRNNGNGRPDNGRPGWNNRGNNNNDRGNAGNRNDQYGRNNDNGNFSGYRGNGNGTTASRGNGGTPSRGTGGQSTSQSDKGNGRITSTNGKFDFNNTNIRQPRRTDFTTRQSSTRETVTMAPQRMESVTVPSRSTGSSTFSRPSTSTSRPSTSFSRPSTSSQSPSSSMSRPSSSMSSSRPASTFSPSRSSSSSTSGFGGGSGRAGGGGHFGGRR